MIRKICVENFGPIKSGCVELTKLVILTGPQNSGKTYFATLIYFVHKEIYDMLLDNITSIVSQVTKKTFIEKLRRVGVTEFDRIKEKSYEIVEEDIDKIIKNMRLNLKKIIEEKLPKYFAYREVKELIHRGESGTTIEAELDVNRTSFTIKITIKREADLDIQLKSTEVLELLKSIISTLHREFSEVLLPFSIILLRFVESIKRGEKEVLYIPSERIVFIPIYYTSISLLTTLFKVPTAHLVEKEFTIKTPILDYIDLVGAALSRGVSGFLIDKRIGEFSVEKGKVFYIDKRGEKYPVESVGSGVSQLIGIFMPINHIGENKLKLVVIEEPEINLHADLHLKVAEYIARLSRKTRVVVTTHSEYFLGKISNLILKGKLRASDVKAYLLYNNKVKELKVTSEGIEIPKTISRTISELSEEALKTHGMVDKQKL